MCWSLGNVEEEKTVLPCLFPPPALLHIFQHHKRDSWSNNKKAVFVGRWHAKITSEVGCHPQDVAPHWEEIHCLPLLILHIHPPKSFPVPLTHVYEQVAQCHAIHLFNNCVVSVVMHGSKIDIEIYIIRMGSQSQGYSDQYYCTYISIPFIASTSCICKSPNILLILPMTAHFAIFLWCALYSPSDKCVESFWKNNNILISCYLVTYQDELLELTSEFDLLQVSSPMDISDSGEKTCPLLSSLHRPCWTDVWQELPTRQDLIQCKFRLACTEVCLNGKSIREQMWSIVLSPWG